MHMHTCPYLHNPSLTVPTTNNPLKDYSLTLEILPNLNMCLTKLTGIIVIIICMEITM
jgi:hypothetical protein